MSGGVDSAVVAALLAEAGHEVIGVTLQLYDLGKATAKPGACCAGRDIIDARRVADAIGIPHFVLDYEERFRRSVIDSFADSYLSGETPVPCVLCNAGVKFSDLMQAARELGAEALATGHYVRRVAGAGGLELHRAAEAARDQSYFLFTMTREQLEFVRFPLGDLPKAETRAIAGRLGLPVASKPDSQDICFVPQGRYGDIVAKMRAGQVRPGAIVDLEGRVLGQHEGIIHFTIGQRKGLGLATGEPLFVVRLDPARAEVVVGPREALRASEIRLRAVNWLGDEPLGAMPRPVLARVRSTRAPVMAEVSATGDGGASVRLAAPEEAVAPGQACVFYSPEGGSRVLGGGWITRSP